MKIKNPNTIPLFLIIALASLNYSRILALNDVYLDDNCWLLSLDVSSGLQEFISNGFAQLRRELLGVFLYVFFWPYRIIGDHAMLIWHAITLGIQITTPVVLYYFVCSLTNNRRDVATFIAAIFIITTLDQMAPFLSTINYRLALLLGLLSLYGTERAVRGGEIDRKKLVVALMTGGVGEYVFHEGVIAFEPARLLLLWLLRGRPGKPNSVAIRQILLLWLPFAVITLPLIAYKLLFKPFGVYEGYYATGMEHFANWPAIYEMLRLFILGNWWALQDFISYLRPFTIILSLAASVVTLFVTLRIINNTKPGQHHDTLRDVMLIGVGILIPQIIFFGLAGRLPGIGDRTMYATMMQPGYAMLVGTVVWWFICRFLVISHKAKPLLASGLFAAFAGIGAFYNNLNLDMFAVASKRQQAFWEAFVTRFPNLPERADFLIDAVPLPYARGNPTYYYVEDLRNAYEFEFGLARRYSESKSSDNVRRYRVIPIKHFARYLHRSGPEIFEIDVKVTSQFGADIIQPNELIVVRHSNGRLLINHEIVDHYPNIIYHPWANKPLPTFSVPHD